MVNTNIKTAWLALCLLLPAGSYADEQQIYKHVGENGEIHFSQFPPSTDEADSNTQVIKIKTSPTTDAAAPSESVQPAATGTENTADNQQPESDESDSNIGKNKAVFEKNCQIAKKNKQLYEDNPGRRFMDSEGNVFKYTEEQRQEKIQEAQEKIEFYCR